MLRRVHVMRIYSSITKDLKFDSSIQVTWKQRTYSQVQQHESWRMFQLLSFLLTVMAGGLLKLNVLFWVNIYSYLQTVFKEGLFKNLSQFAGKYPCLSLLLISQQYFLIRDPGIYALLRILRTVKSTIFTDHLGSTASVVLNISVISHVLISHVGMISLSS